MLDLMEIFSPVFWLWMMNSPGEDAENTLTRDLARSRSGAASIQRRSPPSTLKMSNGGIMAGRCVSNHTGPAMSTPFAHGSQATYLGLRRLSGCKNERQPRRWLRQLGEAQDVAVGILEPGDFGAARGSPDAFGILCGQAIAFEMHAFLFESGNGCGDIRDLPPENGERLRLEGRGDVGNTEHYAVGVEGQGKIVLA